MIVAVLLRSLIAPLYVIATVMLSYAFALGVSALVFDESDPAQPLFTFVFLVALGVDYNIFLIARIREEGARRSRGAGCETGGVITSAGLILAGTFCTLLATELESLFQVGFTVALGLLVDTFLIRIFLVPSIALLLGSRAHMSENAPRAAVVGAGPSGFYATDQLLKAGFEVDLLEVLPTPFGLVRAGVAPDHPKIKSVTRVYEKTAQAPGLPLLRRASSSAATSAARTCSTATTSCSTRSAPRPTTGSASPARTAPARTARWSSWPGTTATRTTPTTSSTSAPRARS